MSTSSTFQNDHLNVTFRREPGCLCFMDVTVSPEATKAARRKAAKKINSEISVPGFRKGKAPEAVVLKNFGKHIESEWKDILLETTFFEAMQLTKTPPFRKDSVSKAAIKKISEETGSELSFEYEAAPTVPSIKPEDLALAPVEKIQVSDKDIEAALKNLKLNAAEWQEINDRPAKEGDYVEIDVDIISEPARNVCTRALFEIAPDKMEAWTRNLLVGMKPGEMKEGMSEEEECGACADGTHTHDHPHAKMAPAKCRVMLHAIKTPVLPEITDEFAKKYGANDVADLMEKLRMSLNRNAEESYQNVLRNMMHQKLLETYHFDIPQTTIKQNLKDIRKRIIQDLEEKGTNQADIPSEAKKIEDGVSKQLEGDFIFYNLIQKIIDENNISVSDHEVTLEMLQEMWSNPNQRSKTEEELELDKKNIRNGLFAKKALDFLIDKTQVKA